MELSRSIHIALRAAVFFTLLATFVSAADKTVDTPKQDPDAPSLAIGKLVVVETGEEPRTDSPASIEWSHWDPSHDSAKVPMVRLVEITGGNERFVHSQFELSKTPRIWWIVDGTTPPNSKRIYRIDAELPKNGDDEKRPVVDVHRQPEFVEFRIGASPVLRYNASHVEVTEAVDPIYGRSAHLHPAWTPAGVIVTDQFPPDHAHQSGIFLANTNTEFEGRTPDFWNLSKGTGRVRFKEIVKIVSGPVFGDLIVEHEHVDLSVPGGKVAMLETWSVRVWNQFDSKSTFRICDITSQMACATSSPVRLKEYHYGGMALRGAREWIPENCRFVTSEGKSRIDGNHTRPRWCDLNGNVNGKHAGITIMTHAENFRYPEPLRIHPTMPYMVYTPSQLGDWDLVPGKPVVSKYRFLFHDGEIPVETADRLSNDFSKPLASVPATTTSD